MGMRTHRVLQRSVFFPLLLSVEFFFGSMVGALPVHPSMIDNTAVLALAPHTDKSLNWSGYVADGGGYTAVSGSWVVPVVEPGDTLAADATWVGIGGVQNHNLIQAGTQAVVEPDGTVEYQAWVEALPHESTPVPLLVRAGDIVSAELNEESPGYWHVSIRNITSGKKFETTMAYDSQHVSAEWIQEMPTGNVFIALDNFHTLDFLSTSAVQKGKTVTPFVAKARALTMVNGAGEPLAVPTTLSENGGAFRVQRTEAHIVPARDAFAEDMAKTAF